MGQVAGLSMKGMSSILTPCDKNFTAKGIAAEFPPNKETVITAEEETEMLYEIRERGSAVIPRLLSLV
jgi:hypothetical protein